MRRRLTDRVCRLIAWWVAQLPPARREWGEAVLAELDRLERSISGIDVDADLFAQVASRLEVLRSKWQSLRTEASGEEDDAFDFDSATDEEVFDMLDNELGLS